MILHCEMDAAGNGGEKRNAKIIIWHYSKQKPKKTYNLNASLQWMKRENEQKWRKKQNQEKKKYKKITEHEKLRVGNFLFSFLHHSINHIGLMFLYVCILSVYCTIATTTEWMFVF